MLVVIKIVKLINNTIQEIKVFGWAKIEHELYSTLTNEEFFNLIDEHYIEMTISEVPSKRNACERIYRWFKE